MIAVAAYYLTAQHGFDPTFIVLLLSLIDTINLYDNRYVST